MGTRNTKIINAYNFLLKKETSNTPFSLEELIKASGWSITTIKTYINKQLRSFISQSEKKDKYLCNGVSSISQDEFIKINSQKIKYSTDTINDRDSLIVKARQFSLLAIYAYNNPYSEFKTYCYIVNMIIAWTSLMHAILQKKGISYFHKTKEGKPIITDGDQKTWELSECVDKYWKKASPAKSNLEFLIRLRNKIEHRNLPLIDPLVAGHCQSCLNNFESILIKEFGDKYALSSNITLALQLSRTHEHKVALKEIQKHYMAEIEKFMDEFESELPDKFFPRSEYCVRYFFTAKTSNQKTSSDIAYEFVRAGSEEEEKVNRILVKEREKEKFKPRAIVELMKTEGYKKFNMTHHTKLWKSKDAKKSGNYGIQLSDGQWYWYPCWLEVVRNYCRTSNM